VAKSEARRITKRSVLAVEGKDEVNFFEVLLDHIHIGVAEVQILDVGGKDQFPKKFPALLKVPGFFEPDNSPRVRNLAIVRDKDGDDAFKSVANIVKTAGLTPPDCDGGFSEGRLRVGIFIMPGQIDGTMLEDLCLKTVERHKAMPCVDQFASCVGALSSGPKNMSKAKAQAFLAAQPEAVGAVGLGAQKGYWNFASPALAELKTFLNNLRGEKKGNGHQATVRPWAGRGGRDA